MYFTGLSATMTYSAAYGNDRPVEKVDACFVNTISLMDRNCHCSVEGWQSEFNHDRSTRQVALRNRPEFLDVSIR